MEQQKMVHLKASCRQIYGGKYLTPGDPFPAPVPENVAAGLIRNHYAELDQSYQTRSRPRIERKDLAAEEPVAAAPEPAATVSEPTAETETEVASEEPEAETPRRQGRRYNRRDLKAEDA